MKKFNIFKPELLNERERERERRRRRRRNRDLSPIQTGYTKGQKRTAKFLIDHM